MQPHLVKKGMGSISQKGYKEYVWNFSKSKILSGHFNYHDFLRYLNISLWFLS